MNSLCSISGHGFLGTTGVPGLFTVPYTTSTISIAGYSATPTGCKIRWTGGDALTVYTNNTSTMTFTVNGVNLVPVITYDGTNIFAVFSGLTNVAWTVVITSSVGTHATSSITVPQAPSSLSAGGTQYLNVPSPIRNTLNTFTTNCPITTSFSRMYYTFTCFVNSGSVRELVNIKDTTGLYNQYGWGIDTYVENGILTLNINSFPLNASTPNMGFVLVFDQTTINLNNNAYHSFYIVVTPTLISVQVDSGFVHTIGTIATLWWAGTDYNFTDTWVGSNWGYSGVINYSNLIVTN